MKNKLLTLQIACFFIIFWSGYRVLDGFLFDDQTQIYESCSAVLNGQMLVFGGMNPYQRQWSSVASCSLRSEGKLDFDFYHGACNTIQVKFFRSYSINNILYKLENSSEINFILLFREFYKILIQVRNSDKRPQTIIIKPSFALLHPKKLNVDRKFDY